MRKRMKNLTTEDTEKEVKAAVFLLLSCISVNSVVFSLFSFGTVEQAPGDNAAPLIAERKSFL
jgi:hypothetical protein